MKKSSALKGCQTSRASTNQLDSNQQHAHTAAATQLEAEERSIFPFLDLAPELRNMVYEYCTPDDGTMRDRDLATLQLPAITRVCRQLRQESMGYMFENRAFELCLGTNLWSRYPHYIDFWKARWDPMPDCGTLGLNPTITVYKSQDIPYVRYQHDKSRSPGRAEREASMVSQVEAFRVSRQLAVMHLTVENGELMVDISRGRVDTMTTQGLASISTHSEPTVAFRFLDLPPELRDCIYSFVTSDLGSQSLAFFKPPPITRVSKAVRCESLAALFAEGNTRVIGGTDFFRHSPTSNQPIMQSLRPDYASRGSGSLGLHPVVERSIIDAKSAALFGNVPFNVHHPIVLLDGPGRALWDNSFHMRTFKLRVRSGVVALEERSASPCYKISRLSTKADFQAALDVVIQVAQQIASRGHFNGFALDDLKAVASKFRFF
ncbi:hypothetical protein AC579_1408 [Pseudocercospora musae]|uniref:Uncharacterized protein n=1 Tax=Pseudocercospora musae TaxID=113226 RepID=A0A139IFT7_9PEZI|nr:hypothetical protein AC579_1408 [Pseudocercospora musae]